MASHDPDEIERIEMVMRRMMRHFFGPMPAKVTAVSSAQNKTTRVDLVPLFNIPQQDRETLELSHSKAQEIPDVPVVVPASAASRQGLKIASGDIGLYIPLMYAPHQLIDTDETDPVNVDDPDQLPYNSGLFIPFEWNRELTDEEAAADRTIVGQDVRVGDAAAAESLAFRQSTDDKLDAQRIEILNYVDAAIAALVAANGPSVPPGTPLASLSPGTPVTKPGKQNVDGTDHLTGS